MMVSVEVSVATMEQASAHHGADAASQEIITEILLSAAEASTEQRDARKVEYEDDEVDWADLHRFAPGRTRDANCAVQRLSSGVRPDATRKAFG